MKKKLLIALGLLVVAALGLGLFAVSNASSIINQYKPQIESLASSFLGSKVTLGKVQAHFFPETKLSIAEFSIGEKNSGEDLSLKNITCKVDPFALLKKQIVIKEFSITDPSISITKDASGMKIPGVPKAAQAKPAPTPADTAQTPLPITLSLDRFSMSGGAFVFNDQTQGRIISAKNLTLESSVALEGNVVLLKNISVQTTLPGESTFKASIESASYRLNDSFIEAPAVTATLGSSTITLSRFTMNKAAEMSYSLSGQNLEAADFLQTLTAMKFTPDTLKAKGNFGVEAQGELSPKALSAKSLSLNIFGGSVTAPSSLGFGDVVSFSSKPSLANIQLDKVFEFMAPGTQSKIFGLLTKASGSAEGELGAALKEKLSAQFSFAIEKGGVRGVNIAGKALQNVNNLPFISGSLLSNVPKEFHATLTAPDTEFTSLTGGFAIQGGRMSLKGIKLVNPVYSIEADGSLGFDSSVDLNATITFSRVFSLALVGVAHDFKKILTPQETLVFPLTIQGTLPGVVIVPNLTKVLQLAGEKIIVEKASEALGNVLKGKGKGLGSILGF